MEMEDISIHAWIQKYQIKNETGKPLDFKQHGFWFDILSDNSPKQVWLKAAQVGGSLIANIKLFWCVKKMGMNAIYTMPTAGDVADFVGGKTNPLIDNNPILFDYIKDKDSVQQKRVGDNTIYFRGTMTERAALSVSSDLNIYDEEDRSDAQTIEQYASRLQASPYKWEWHFSNPSVEGNGVSKYWARSDQKHWFIACGACQKQQYLSFPENIDMDKEYFICKFCHAELTDEMRSHGEWRKKKTDYTPEYSGYWISLLMCTWISAKQILELYRTKSPEYFSNFVLGLPYTGDGNKIQENEFFQNTTAAPFALENPIIIGLDTGLPNWYVVGNSHGAFSAGSCQGYDEIEGMLKRWPEAIVVCDQGGDLIGQRLLQEKYPSRVFLCYYRADRKSMTLVRWGEKEEYGTVIVDRNRMMQFLIDELRMGRLPLLGKREDWCETWTHFANIFRVNAQDALGNDVPKWERSGPDHLCHAMLYWRVGMEKFIGTSATVVAGHSFFEDIPRSFAVDPETNAVSMEAFLNMQPKKKDWRDV